MSVFCLKVEETRMDYNTLGVKSRATCAEEIIY